MNNQVDKGMNSYYAPVIIPTLCRYEHFKLCIESLNSCIGAEYTEVYVGLDYPTKESHWDGHNKIKDYLATTKFRFKNLVIFERERNYGFGPHGNLESLRESVFKKYDRYILTEDDNEFSPNFLKYVNKGLQLYEDAPDVFAICGYNYNIPMTEVPGSTYLSYEYSAWGVGSWKEKTLKRQSVHNAEYLKSVLTSFRKMYTIYQNEPRLLNTLIYIYKSGQIYGDTVNVCYQYLNRELCLFPKLSLVKNHGFDKSGSTITKKDESFANQDIDHSDKFEMIKLQIEASPQGMYYTKKYWKRPLWMNVAIFLRIVWLAWTGKDLFYYIDQRKHKGVTMLKSKISSNEKL